MSSWESSYGGWGGLTRASVAGTWKGSIGLLLLGPSLHHQDKAGQSLMNSDTAMQTPHGSLQMLLCNYY